MFTEDISEEFSEYRLLLDFEVFSGYLRNLRGRLLSSEKFSEVFALWVLTLKPFPGYCNPGHAHFRGDALGGGVCGLWSPNMEINANMPLRKGP